MKPWERYAEPQAAGPWVKYAAPVAEARDESFPASLGRQVINAAAGAVRGAGSIGATILAPVDAAARALGVQNEFIGRDDRRESMTEFMKDRGADTDSLAFQGGKLGAEIAGTLGVGGAAANTLARVPGLAAKAPAALEAVRTAGMSAGGATGVSGVAARVAGGATTGAASAGLVNPSDTGTGALAGGALPVAAKLAGATGNAIGKAIRGGGVAPEVAALAQRAKALGIDIPADRLVHSKPLDAVASGLNYVPFSGRAATEAKMAEQLNRAGSRLIGQNTPNMNQALRAASSELGAKFDMTLRGTGVQFDQQLLQDVTRVFNTAEKELGSDALKAISSQVDDLVEKGATGVVDGQAAYNIKRTLDRIGQRNGPEAFHALELKGVLMDGLNRSLGPEKAQAFAKTRQQYGNMLALEKLAKNGVEGEISVARLANLGNINNEPLQELADIAAQFVKPREGMHGAMQRAVVGSGAAATAAATLGLPGLVGVAGLSAGARGTNALLSSEAMRKLMLGGGPPAAPGRLSDLMYRAAPVLAGDR